MSDTPTPSSAGSTALREAIYHGVWDRLCHHHRNACYPDAMQPEIKRDVDDLVDFICEEAARIPSVAQAGRPIDDVIKGLPEERREKIAARTAELAQASGEMTAKLREGTEFASDPFARSSADTDLVTRLFAEADVWQVGTPLNELLTEAANTIGAQAMRLDACDAEIERLRHDIERYIQIASDLASEPQTAPQSIETAPRDGTPILYWDDKCAIPETVCWLNGSRIAKHGWYPYAGGNWFVDAEREKGAIWWPLPSPLSRPHHD